MTVTVPPVPVKATGLIPSPDGPHYQLADYTRPVGVPDTIAYTPPTPVLYQASQPECAGFTTEKILGWHNQGEYPTWLSPQWAYREGKERDGYDGPGTSFWAIFQGMRHEGICLEEDWPFEDRWPPLASPGPDAVANAAKYKIETYAQVQQAEIHNALYQFGPLALGVKVFTSFYQTGADGIVPAVGGSLDGGHGLPIFFSDLTDAIFPGGVIGGPNSWSLRWGKDGWYFIPYQRLTAMFMEAWSIVDVKDIPLRWPDLTDMAPSDDDILSQDKAWQKGAMRGYPDGTFRPSLVVTQRQVGTVLCNLGLITENPWENRWVDKATRQWTHENFPQLQFNSQLGGDLTRYHLLLLVGRYLRGL